MCSSDLVVDEDVGVLGEEAEDEPGEEVIELLAAGVAFPVGVVLKQFAVQLIKPSRGPDIEGVLPDLADGQMPASSRKKAKWSGRAA